VGLKDSNNGGYDEFGSSAPVSGDKEVVGSIAETACVFTGTGIVPPGSPSCATAAAAAFSASLVFSI